MYHLSMLELIKCASQFHAPGIKPSPWATSGVAFLSCPVPRDCWVGSSRILVLPEIDRWGFSISFPTSLYTPPYHLPSASVPLLSAPFPSATVWFRTPASVSVRLACHPLPVLVTWPCCSPRASGDAFSHWAITAPPKHSQEVCHESTCRVLANPRGL